MLVETGQAGDRLARVLGVASQLEGVRAVEAVAKTNLALLLTVSLFQRHVLDNLPPKSSEARILKTYTLQDSLGGMVGLRGALGAN